MRLRPVFFLLGVFWFLVCFGVFRYIKQRHPAQAESDYVTPTLHITNVTVEPYAVFGMAMQYPEMRVVERGDLGSVSYIIVESKRNGLRFLVVCNSRGVAVQPMGSVITNYVVCP